MFTKQTAVLFITIFAIFTVGCGAKHIVVIAPGTPPPVTTDKKAVTVQLKDCTTIIDRAEKEVCILEEQLIQADVKKQAVKAEDKADPYHKKARQILAREPQAIADSYLQGCPAGTVWVNPDDVISEKQDLVHAFFRANIHSMMTINNSSKEYVDIERIQGGSGIAVKHLCPGGNIHLSQYMNFGGIDAVQYKAVARDGKGRSATSLSPVINMTSCQNTYICNPETAQDWKIILY
jgi:hypothetical protein